MMQRSYSLHVRGNEGVDQGTGSPASPGGTILWPLPNSPAPVQRSISVLLDHHDSSGNARADSPHEHENSKQYIGGRLKAEQTVHLIPLVLFLCALILWLGTQSE